MSTIPIQKTLSKEELYTLIQNYQKNHDQKSKEMIILSNTKLVLSLMKRFYQKSNHYEDLFQVGIVGLIKAVDHFDTNYQLQFSTYAVPLIIGEMKRYLRDNTQVKISRPIKDLAYAILKEKEKYLNQYQREPTIQELSQNLNIEKQNIIEAMQSTQSIASFQDVVGNDNQNELSLSDIVSLDPETLKHYHDHLDLKNAFDCLNQREKKVIQERYYQGYSQCEIADELFVSQAQISRIEKKALEKLHKKVVYSIFYRGDRMRFVSLQSKDVINVYDGKKIGYIADIELDWCQKCIRALIVEKMNFFHFFCFFKEPPVLVIPIECVISLKGDVILVNIEQV